MAEQMLELGAGLELWRVGIDEVREQDVNARAMPKAMLERLAATIQRDQRLESLPLVARTGEESFEIVSGHHRVRAARMAGVDALYVLMDVSGLTPSQVKAKQLAHNAIQGEDDAELVARIFEAIEDVEMRLEAFIDVKELNKRLERVSVPAMDVGLEYHTALVMFLPSEKERFEAAVEAVKLVMGSGLEEGFLADLALYEQWRAAMKATQTAFEVRSVGTLFSQMAKLVLERLGQPDPVEEIEEDVEVVSLADIFGRSMVPKEAAEVMKAAVAEMQRRKVVGEKNAWQVIEYLAADFLAGAPQA